MRVAHRDRYTTPAACGYGLRARYSNCQRTVALVSGRLSVPEYSVRVAPRRTFSRRGPNIVTAGSQFLFCDPAVSESNGIYMTLAGILLRFGHVLG